MTLHIQSTRKVVQLAWDKEKLQGSHVSVQVYEDGEWKEKENYENDGNGNIYFGADFVGDVKVRVKGTKEGVEEATLHVK